MNKHMDLDHHFCITSAGKVSEIVKPLTSAFDIKHFRYLRIYKDKSRILLTNFPDCVRFIYETENYKKMWFDGEYPDYLEAGFNLWKSTDTADKTAFEKEINHCLKLCNGMTYVNRSHDCWELFTFDSNEDHLHSYDRKIFIHFMFYFMEQAQGLIEIGNKERLIIPGCSALPKDKRFDDDKIAAFFNATPVDRYYLSGKYQDVYLTRKEVCCIYWIIQGKTAEEIAMIEGNSKKTIERHLENVRLKLKCYKQSQIINIVINSGVLDSLSLVEKCK